MTIIFANLSSKMIENLFNTCDHIVVCITLLLPMEQLYITQMMMLIFTIILMHSYIHLVCLVCLVLKNTYFKEHPWVIASKYSISNTEDNRNLNYVYYLNLTPMEKVLFLAPLECSHNGKGIMVPIKYIFMVYSPKGKDMIL